MKRHIINSDASLVDANVGRTGSQSGGGGD